MNIEELDWSVLTYNRLKSANIDTIEKLRTFDEEDLKRIRHMSSRCIQEIHDKLSEINS